MVTEWRVVRLLLESTLTPAVGATDGSGTPAALLPPVPLKVPLMKSPLGPNANGLVGSGIIPCALV